MDRVAKIADLLLIALMAALWYGGFEPPGWMLVATAIWATILAGCYTVVYLAKR